MQGGVAGVDLGGAAAMKDSSWRFEPSSRQRRIGRQQACGGAMVVRTGACRMNPMRSGISTDDTVATGTPGMSGHPVRWAMLGRLAAGPVFVGPVRVEGVCAVKAGRIVMIVVGAILALIGVALLAGGGAGVVAYATQRTDGYFQTGTVRLATATYAVTSDRVDLQSEPGDDDWLIDRGALGSVRLTVDPGRAGGRRSSPASRRPPTWATYLDGVSHDVIRDFELSPDRVLFRRVPGEATPAPPGEQSIWVAQVTRSSRTN